MNPVPDGRVDFEDVAAFVRGVERRRRLPLADLGPFTGRTRPRFYVRARWPSRCTRSARADAPCTRGMRARAGEVMQLPPSRPGNGLLWTQTALWPSWPVRRGRAGRWKSVARGKRVFERAFHCDRARRGTAALRSGSGRGTGRFRRCSCSRGAATRSKSARAGSAMRPLHRNVLAQIHAGRRARAGPRTCVRTARCAGRMHRRGNDGAGSGRRVRRWTFQLAHPYPNPFNSATTFTFTLPEAGRARLRLFNLLGQDAGRDL